MGAAALACSCSAVRHGKAGQPGWDDAEQRGDQDSNKDGVAEAIVGMRNGEGGLVAGWAMAEEEGEKREDAESAKSSGRGGWTTRPHIVVLLKQ